MEELGRAQQRALRAAAAKRKIEIGLMQRDVVETIASRTRRRNVQDRLADRRRLIWDADGLVLIGFGFVRGATLRPVLARGGTVAEDDLFAEQYARAPVQQGNLVITSKKSAPSIYIRLPQSLVQRVLENGLGPPPPGQVFRPTVRRRTARGPSGWRRQWDSNSYVRTQVLGDTDHSLHGLGGAPHWLNSRIGYVATNPFEHDGVAVVAVSVLACHEGAETETAEWATWRDRVLDLPPRIIFCRTDSLQAVYEDLPDREFEANGVDSDGISISPTPSEQEEGVYHQATPSQKSESGSAAAEVRSDSRDSSVLASSNSERYHTGSAAAEVRSESCNSSVLASSNSESDHATFRSPHYSTLGGVVLSVAADELAGGGPTAGNKAARDGAIAGQRLMGSNPSVARGRQEWQPLQRSNFFFYAGNGLKQRKLALLAALNNIARDWTAAQTPTMFESGPSKGSYCDVYLTAQLTSEVPYQSAASPGSFNIVKGSGTGAIHVEDTMLHKGVMGPLQIVSGSKYDEVTRTTKLAPHVHVSTRKDQYGRLKAVETLLGRPCAFRLLRDTNQVTRCNQTLSALATAAATDDAAGEALRIGLPVFTSFVFPDRSTIEPSEAPVALMVMTAVVPMRKHLARLKKYKKKIPNGAAAFAHEVAGFADRQLKANKSIDSPAFTFWTDMKIDNLGVDLGREAGTQIQYLDIDSALVSDLIPITPSIDTYTGMNLRARGFRHVSTAVEHMAECMETTVTTRAKRSKAVRSPSPAELTTWCKRVAQYETAVTTVLATLRMISDMLPSPATDLVNLCTKDFRVTGDRPDFDRLATLYMLFKTLRRDDQSSDLAATPVSTTTRDVLAIVKEHLDTAYQARDELLKETGCIEKKGEDEAYRTFAAFSPPGRFVDHAAIVA